MHSVLPLKLGVTTLSVLDLTGRLKAAEDSFNDALMTVHHDGKLCMTAEEWESRKKKGDDKRAGGGSGSSGSRGGGRSRGHGRVRGNSDLRQAG
jgi:hypothetical protein